MSEQKPTSTLCMKARYADEDSAQRALEDVRHERGKPKRDVRKIETRVYFHPDCDSWHLTSEPRRKGSSAASQTATATGETSHKETS